MPHTAVIWLGGYSDTCDSFVAVCDATVPLERPILWLLRERSLAERLESRSQGGCLNDSELRSLTKRGWYEGRKGIPSVAHVDLGVGRVAQPHHFPCPIEEGKTGGAEKGFVVVGSVYPRSAGDRGDDDFHRSWFTGTAWCRCVE